MAWIEEEREKRLQEKEQEKERALSESEKWKQKVKHIEEFWNDMLKANDNLPEDLRLDIGSKYIYGKTMTMTLEGDSIKISDEKTLWEPYRIFFDTEKQRLVAKENIVIYELDKNSISTILKNLCTGTDIKSGLQLDPSLRAAIAAKQSNLIIGLFVFIVFDLVISAINAKSVDEFFAMIFAFPLVIFIIVKIAQFIRMVFS